MTLGRMKNKKGENGWEGRGDIEPVESMCLFFRLTKTQSPPIGKKIKGEELLQSNV